MDYFGPFVAHIAYGWINPEPLERLGWFTLVQHHLLGAFLWRGGVQPLSRQVRRQHYGSPVVDVHHAASAISSDDNEAVMLAWAFISIR